MATSIYDQKPEMPYIHDYFHELIFLVPYFPQSLKLKGLNGPNANKTGLSIEQKLLYSKETALKLLKRTYPNDKRIKSLTDMELVELLISRYPKDGLQDQKKEDSMAADFKQKVLDSQTAIINTKYPFFPFPHKEWNDYLCAGMRWINYSEDEDKLYAFGQCFLSIFYREHTVPDSNANAASDIRPLNIGRYPTLTRIYRWHEYADSAVYRKWKYGKPTDKRFREEYKKITDQFRFPPDRPDL
ncbi:MAG: hypothetical protein LQ352_004498 [Teloschistes flavicans]|nr:MAG: hypothetical protein LQ352_004498 [Teloschistes flavicans]